MMIHFMPPLTDFRMTSEENRARTWTERALHMMLAATIIAVIIMIIALVVRLQGADAAMASRWQMKPASPADDDELPSFRPPQVGG